jgi:glycosyltransferase involved in cell wall biosynthesis
MKYQKSHSDPIIFFVPGTGTGTGGFYYNSKVAESISQSRKIILVDLCLLALHFRQSLPPVIGRFAVYPRIFNFFYSIAVAIRYFPFKGIVLQDYEVSRFTVFLGFLRRIRGFKTITFVYHFDDREAGTRQEALRTRKIRIKFSSTIITISEFTAREISLTGYPDSRVCIAKPGTSWVTSDPQLHFPQTDQPYALTVANLFPHKGIDVPINAVAQCANKELSFLIAGNDQCDLNYTCYLKNLLTQHNLAERVFLLGRVDANRLQHLFEHTIFFVMPSYMEGYCMAVAEARAYGKPVIATHAGALPELVDDRVDGLLVEPGSSSALAAAIDELMENMDLLEATKKASLSRGKTLPTWESTCKIISQAIFS